MTPDTADLASRLYARRLHLGLTQGEVAERVGVTTAYISKIEHGRTSLPVQTLSRVAEALGVSAAKLLQQREAPPPAEPGAERRRPVRAGDQAERRRDILRAATELFTEKGYEKTSIRELAAQSGVSSAGLYHHFRSKYDLFVSLIGGAMDSHFAGLDEALRGYDSPGDQLRHVFRNHLRVHLGHPEVRLVAGDFSPLRGPELDEFIAERDRYEHAIEEIVRHGLRAGVFDVADPKLAVVAALGAANEVDRWYRPGGRLSAEEVTDGIVAFIMAGLGATDATAADDPEAQGTEHERSKSIREQR